MGDGGPHQWNKAHISTGSLSTFADGIRHFTGLAHSHADTAPVVSDNDYRPKAEASAAFDYLGCACDMYYPLIKLFGFFEFWFPSRHIPSH
jgi:hypothetical protein